MKEYEMTQKQLDKIRMEARDSTLRKETTKTAWESLGEEMGFDYRTVTPSRRGDRFFLAEPRPE